MNCGGGQHLSDWESWTRTMKYVLGLNELYSTSQFRESVQR